MENNLDYNGKQELTHLEVSFNSFLNNTYKLVKNFIEGKTIADIGCGTGIYAEKFKRDGYDVSCFEGDTTLVKTAQSRGLSVVQIDILSKTFRENFSQQFDSVYSLDVLEHIENEDEFLQGIYAILKKRGIVVIKVPAYSFLYSDLDKRIGHVRRYSSKQLSKALTRNGFDVEHIRSFNILGFFGWLIICKLLGKSSSEVESGFANLLFSVTLPLERRFFSPFGLSIVAKARKQSHS
ncbi:MAG: class I SAM-dependent methyltransferase [Ignavibacteriales bacterium]|nr:class I SAM-dependent methyltransferase [Ignavibacteriales bacterium]